MAADLVADFSRYLEELGDRGDVDKCSARVPHSSLRERIVDGKSNICVLSRFVGRTQVGGLLVGGDCVGAT